MAELHSHHHISWRRLFKSRSQSEGPEELFAPRTRLHSEPPTTTESSCACNSQSTASADGSESAITLGPMSPLRTHASFSTSSSCNHLSENDALRSIASAAMKQVSSISSNTFVKGTWKQRRSPTSELVLEHRSHNEYRIIAKSMVPCTLDEISSVLSSSSSDHFNASMIELLGHEFVYGVTVRSVPIVGAIGKPSTNSNLALRVIAFSDSTSASIDAEGNYLDLTERDETMGCERRALQTITRTHHGPNGSTHIRAGGALCGYALHEVPETKHTVILLYGTYASGEFEDRAHRHAAIHRYRKLAQLSTKWVSIVLRRRLGAQPILDPLLDASRSLLELSCVGCGEDFHQLFRKRHFCSLCGAHACVSCSSVEDVEQDLGKVRRLRVCRGCVTDVNERALCSRPERGCEDSEGESECYGSRDTLDCAFDDLLLESTPEKVCLL